MGDESVAADPGAGGAEADVSGEPVAMQRDERPDSKDLWSGLRRAQAENTELNAQLDKLKRELAEARSHPGKALGDLVKHRGLKLLSGFSPPLPASMAARFGRSAAKRDPNRSLLSAGEMQARLAKPILAVDQNARLGGGKATDPSKPTIIIVSHEASRTGAPILALNLVQSLQTRYNIISVILGGGPLLGEFQRASVEAYAFAHSEKQKRIEAIVKGICADRKILYAIVNSVVSHTILPSLNAQGIPIVMLVHEFASYTRPRSTFPDILRFSDRVIFSTRITLENALEELGTGHGNAMLVMPQGKCAVPLDTGTDPRKAAEERALLDGILRPEGAAGTDFVVLGAGTVEPRKGLDLFIECANRLINAPGGGRFRFVWIGNGYDPESGAGNAVYLADQIRRSGLEEQVSIVGATAEIEHAYRQADILLLSSRLDPLPNVGIDALVAGRPVLCFERTTGIADFLAQAGLADTCVARYIDTADMAEKIRRLSDDKALLAQVSAQAKAAAEVRFDFARYAADVDGVATSIVSAQVQLDQDATVIVASGRFRQDFHDAPGMSGASLETSVRSYLEAGRTGRGMRKPTPGFHPGLYRAAFPSECAVDPFVSYLRKGEPRGAWMREVLDAAPPSGARGAARVALHVHVEMPAAIEDFARRLRLNTSKPDLFFSVPQAQVGAAREALERAGLIAAAFAPVPEGVQGLGALLTAFGTSLAGSYDWIGHVCLGHADPQRPGMVPAQLELLIGGDCGGAMLDLVLASLSASPEIGLVYPDDPKVFEWGSCRPIAEELGRRMGLGPLPDQIDFPAGESFLCSRSVLDVFARANFEMTDFPSSGEYAKSTQVAALIRLMGVVPGMIHLRTAVTNQRGLSW